MDRSGDALRHGNLAGRLLLGGVLLLAGDDHTWRLSTTCHQSEFAFVDAMIPVLNPAGVQEIIDFRNLRLGTLTLQRLPGSAEMRERHGRSHGIG